MAIYWSSIKASWTRPNFDVLCRKVLRNPYATRALDLIADAVAAISTDLIVIRETNDGTDPIGNHPIWKVLGKPNPRQSTPDFFKQMIYNLFLSGEIVIKMVGPLTRFEPFNWVLINPDRLNSVDVDDETGEHTAYWITPIGGGAPRKHDANEIIFIANYDPQDEYGRGRPLALSILQALDLFDEAMEWGKSIAEHKGRIPGFFVAEKQLGDGTFDRFKAQIQESYSRDSNTGMPGLLEGGVKFEKNAIDPNEANWAAGLINYLRMISAGIGVDPALLGDGQNKTYSNFKEAYRALFMLRVLPLLDWILAQVTCKVMPLYGTPDDVLTYDESTISAIQEDLNAVADRLRGLVTDTVISIDEARSELNYEPRGGLAGELMTGTGRIPLEDAGLTIPVPADPSTDPNEDPANLDEELNLFVDHINQLLKTRSNGKQKTV